MKYLIGLEASIVDKNPLKSFLNQKNNRGEAIIHLAAANRHIGLELVKLLIEQYDADRNVVDERRNTVLRSAARSGNISVKYLIGLEMSELAPNDRSPIKFLDRRNNEGQTLLHSAVQHRRCDGLAIVKLLIEDYNVDRKATDHEGNTVWHWAAKNGDMVAIKYLIKLEMSEEAPKHSKRRSLRFILNQRNNLGQTLLHLAVVNNGLVKLLIEDYDVDRRVIDCNGNSYLHLAIQRYDVLFFKYLIDFEISRQVSSNALKLFLDLRNNQGETLLHLAARHLSCKRSGLSY